MGTTNVPLVGNDFVAPRAKQTPKSNKPKIAPVRAVREIEVDESLLSNVRLEPVTTIGAFSTQPALALPKIELPRISHGFLAIAFAFITLVSSWFLVGQHLNQSKPVAASTSTAPAVFTSAPADRIMAIRNQKITLSVAGTVVNPSPIEIGQWVSTDIADNGSDRLIINKDAISAYLDDLAQPYTKQVVNKIVAVNADGSTRVLNEGSDGKKLDGVDKALTSLSNNLLSGSGMNVNMPLVTVPFKTLTPADLDKLIEVNLNTKRMYVYENGNLIKTFLVTAGADKTPTPQGQFHILEKYDIQDMRGPNVDGSSYYQPGVKWVSYFDHGGDAIHGNHWRPASVFGNVNTSHGCVSLPDDEAQWVYDWAGVGTTITIHS